MNTISVFFPAAKGLRNGSLCILPMDTAVLRYHVFPMECKLVNLPRVELRLVDPGQMGTTATKPLELASGSGALRTNRVSSSFQKGRLLLDPSDIGNVFVFPKARTKQDFK